MSFQCRKIQERGSSFTDTMRKGFNRFQQLNFASVSYRKKSLRVKTSPQGVQREDLVKMLTSKRQRCKQIKIQLKRQREIQIVDFMRKTAKYQQLLDINDHKKKRISLFNPKNPKIGEVIKISTQQNQKLKIQYLLFTNYIPISSAKPQTREGHTTVIYQNNAVVMGGHCSNPLGQGHIFSLSTNTWKRQFNLPSARSYHSTVLYKEKYAVIFGGMGSFDISRKCRPCYKTINVIDLHSLNGKTLKMGSQQQVEGRKLHACTLMGKYMIVFGGINSKRLYLKDIVYLDLKELRWYQKQYRIQGKELNEDMQQGIAKHKAVGHFKENRSTLPLYSSEYNDNEGLYFFGGNFGNRNDNVILFLGLNSYSPTLRKIVYSGNPPSSSNILAQKISQNMVFLISGEVNDRMTKLFKFKQKQFISLYTYQNTPYLGGVGSSLNRCDAGLLILFGMTQTGYSSEVACLNLKQSVKLNQTNNSKIQRRQSIQQWKLFRTIKTTSNIQDHQQNE